VRSNDRSIDVNGFTCSSFLKSAMCNTKLDLQENGEQPPQKWRPGGPAMSSFGGSG
jgi:hypothetical protein